MKYTEQNSFWLVRGLTCILFACSACQATPPATVAPTPSLTPSPEPPVDCSAVEHLLNDSAAAQQILDEFIRNYKEQQPTEYMGMAHLRRVDRLGEWAVVQGSISGDDGQIIVVRQTPRGYQFVEMYLLIPGSEREKLIRQYFEEKIPDAPQGLFTCFEPTWLPGRDGPTPETLPVHELVYIGTDDNTTRGVTEIHSILSDGSNNVLLLSAPMMIMHLTPSPDGERFVFWGCPGAIAYDCVPPEEDLDVWSVNWDGSNLRNLTKDSAASDAHPSWSPDGKQIVFDSDRAGSEQLYIMNVDGSSPKVLTHDSLQNTEPKWSPDGKWIAYHCREGFNTHICVISPEGESAGAPIAGVEPVWSPATADGLHLAFLCSRDRHDDICIARPDGSDIVNLTNTASGEHSPAWSPDGKWLAFVSKRNDDIDIYKVCVTCPGEPVAIRLTDETNPAESPAWSLDGSQVAYVTGNDLMVVGADRTHVRYLVWGVYNLPLWRP